MINQPFPKWILLAGLLFSVQLVMGAQSSGSSYTETRANGFCNPDNAQCRIDLQMMRCAMLTYIATRGFGDSGINAHKKSECQRLLTLMEAQ